MKRIIICSILPIFIFAGGIIGMIYTSNVGNTILSDLEKVEVNFQSEDFEAAKEAAKAIADSWHNFCCLHILISDNSHALEITMSAEKVERLLEQEKDDVLVECGVLRELVRDFCYNQQVRGLNVF